jgi:hypothetical protein
MNHAERIYHIFCLMGTIRAAAKVERVQFEFATIETARTVFDLTPSRYCSVEFELTMAMISSDPLWGGFVSLQLAQDGEGWMGVTDSGLIAIKSASAPGSVTLVELSDDSAGDRLFVDSLSTISGTSVVDPSTDGAYVRVNSNGTPVRMYNPIEIGNLEGSVFSRAYEDPLTLCPALLRDDLASCPSGAGGQTLTTIPPESGQLTGSLLFLCETRSESDGLFHGWACNPSTGDSWRFSFDAEPGWNFADWTFCKDCDPGQIFLLSYNETSFAVDTVLLSALHNDNGQILLADDMIHGRVRLFQSSRTGNVRALSVIRHPWLPEKLRVDIGSNQAESGLTVIHTFSLELTPAGTETLKDIDSSSSNRLSWIVVSLLILLGIALPLIVMHKPRLRKKFEALITGRPPSPAFVAVELEPIGRKPKPLDIVVE